MSSPLAVIGLTFDGTDVQRSDLGIFLELVRGLGEPPEVRGVDVVIPARSGRYVRNRVADRLVIELRGYVMGTGAPAMAPETAGGADTTLTADAAAGAAVIVVASNGSMTAGDYLRIGDTGETEIRRIAPGGISGTTITLTAPLAWAHDSGDQVREVDSAGSSGDRANFRANAHAVRTLFDPTAEPADLVAALEDGSTATIAARTLNAVWDQRAPEIAAVSIELESVDPDWSIT
jgi:hypothetical protein